MPEQHVQVEHHVEGELRDLEFSQIAGCGKVEMYPRFIDRDVPLFYVDTSLESSEVALPAQVLPVLRAEGGHEVVAVHDDVDGRVDDGRRHRRAARHVRSRDPVMGG